MLNERICEQKGLHALKPWQDPERGEGESGLSDKLAVMQSIEGKSHQRSDTEQCNHLLYCCILVMTVWKIKELDSLMMLFNP